MILLCFVTVCVMWDCNGKTGCSHIWLYCFYVVNFKYLCMLQIKWRKKGALPVEKASLFLFWFLFLFFFTAKCSYVSKMLLGRKSSVAKVERSHWSLHQCSGHPYSCSYWSNIFISPKKSPVFPLYTVFLKTVAIINVL